MSDDPRSTPRPPAASDAPTGQLRASAGLSIEVVGDTHPGRVRPGNEDNLIFEPPTSAQARSQGTLLVVSDGMGGHAAGEVASEIAVKTIHATYYRNRGLPADDAIRDAIITANGAIYEAAQRNKERAGMGCTVVALAVQGAALTIGHVGDSRAYLIRGGRATQLTMDHSWVAMQVHEGILTPAQAEHHPNRSVLMRALGRGPSVEMDISSRTLQAGDILLVCSDGLTGMVTDEEIAEYASRIPPRQLPRQLIDLANERGAPDNVTVLIGAITSTLPTTQTAAPVAHPGSRVSDSTTTIITAQPAVALDGRTSRMDPPPGDVPTDRNLPRPQQTPPPAPQQGATVSLGQGVRPPAAAPGPVPGPATSRGAVPPGVVPSGARSGPNQAHVQPHAQGAGAPLGKPVVVSRTSVTQPDGSRGNQRRGRGRWIAGAVAAFGIAGVLVLFSIYQLTRDSAPPAGSSNSTQVPGATTTPPPASAATSPPTNPALLLPAPSAPTALPTATSPASSGASSAVPSKPASTAPEPAGSPAATAGPTLALPNVTAIATAASGILPQIAAPARTPATVDTAVPGGGGSGSTGGGGGGGDGSGGAGGAGSTAATTDPSTDESPAADATPVSGASGAAPGPAADGTPVPEPQPQPQPLPPPGGNAAPAGRPPFTIPPGIRPNNSNSSSNRGGR